MLPTASSNASSDLVFLIVSRCGALTAYVRGGQTLSVEGHIENFSASGDAYIFCLLLKINYSLHHTKYMNES